AGQGVLTVNANGTLTFDPNDNFTGTVNFTYTARDGAGALSAPANVTLNVTPVNDAPIANADIGTPPTSLATFSTNEDVAVQVNLLANDTDVEDGTPPSIGRINGTVLTTPGAQTINVVGGTVVWNGGGLITFTPAPNSNTDAFFTYTAKDSGGL